MKKNISINISGIIFHIEEDGYERLKEYLESINKYFSALDDSGEIVSDIENRIAEIFFSKLKDGKQVITAADIEDLVATMGSVEDFEAEAVSQQEEEEKQQEYTQQQSSAQQSQTATRKLYRDIKRRLLGGVCAGIAHTLKVDPIWIRLLFIALILDLFFSSTVGLISLLTYIVLWIILPPAYELEEDTKIRKMYRDPENRVIGGIASGLAAYFGSDSNVIRLLFVVMTFFGGTGLIAYLILWIITPEARTLTDRMQMQGEPLTLSNIEHNIKKSLNVREDEEESPLVKILLFPFRLIALLLETLARVLGPLMQFLGEAIRILFGIVVVVTGLGVLSSLLGFSFSMINGYPQWADSEVFMQGVPFEIIRQSIPTVTSVSGIFALAIPALALIFAGAALILKRSVLNTKISWSLFGIWLIAGLVFGISFYPLAMQFDDQASFVRTTNYNLEGKQAVLKLNWTGMEDYEVTRLKLRSTDSKTFALKERFTARGSSHSNAIDNAQMVDYHVEQQDSILMFDSNISFLPEGKFRMQKLDMTLEIPNNYPFRIEKEMTEIIRNTLGLYGIRSRELDGNTFMFIDDKLECITCKDYTKQKYYSKVDRNPYNVDIDDLPADFGPEGYQKTVVLKDFLAVEARDFVQLNLQKGKEYKVILSGDEKWVRKTQVEKKGKQLMISLNANRKDWPIGNPPVKVNLTMPELFELSLEDKAQAIVRSFDSDDLRISLSGETSADVAVDSREVMADLTGNSVLELKGRGRYLLGDIANNAMLEAYQFNSRNAELELKNEADAEVYVRYKLNVEALNNSQVTYRGNPDVQMMSGNRSAVRKD